MAYIKLDDRFPDHPKIVRAGPDAAYLYVCGLCYCNRYLTDGYIPEAIVPRLVPYTEEQIKQTVSKLLDARLWHVSSNSEAHNGYEVHGYLEYQSGRASVEAIRAARQKAGQAGGIASQIRQAADREGVKQIKQTSSLRKKEEGRTKNEELSTTPFIPLAGGTPADEKKGLRLVSEEFIVKMISKYPQWLAEEVRERIALALATQHPQNIATWNSMSRTGYGMTQNEEDAPMDDKQRQHLLRLASLPSTAKLEKEAQDEETRLRERTTPFSMGPMWGQAATIVRVISPDYAERIASGKERDAIAATRPEGCWCLGVGGRKQTHLSYSQKEVFIEHCSCPAGIEAEGLHRAWRDQDIDARDAAQVERAWSNAQIPNRFQEFTLASSPLAKSNPALIKRLTYPVPPDNDVGDDEFSAWMKSYQDPWRGSWFFWGSYGVGKTGLALGYAREALLDLVGSWSNVSMRFISVPRMLSHLRSTYSSKKGEETEEDALAAYITPPLLVMDDLGAEQITGSGWVEDRLYQIIGERHGAGEDYWTVFTSNLSLKELAARIGERICWRIVEMCGDSHIVHVTGRNLRVLPS